MAAASTDSRVPGMPRQHFVHVVRTAGTGGVETHVRSMIRLMQARGLEVTLVSLAREAPHRQFVELGCQIVSLHDESGWGWHTVKSGLALIGVLRRLRPDVVHVHGARPILLGTLAAKAAGSGAVVCSLHGAHDLMVVRDDGTIGPVGAWFARVVHGLGFLLSDAVVICAGRLRRDVEVSLATASAGFPGRALRKVQLVHHGIDLLPFASATPARPPAEGRPFVVGTLCRLDEPKKGVAVLLKAVAALESRGIQVSLRIAGGGHSRSSLERQAATLDLRDCQFLGFVEDAPSFYATLDVFVLPSFSEGMPLVNLEAMASGLPVVTSDVGGAAEAVLDGDCGLVVPPGDVGALASALEVLARDSGRRTRFGQAGFDRARRHFSLDAMFEKLRAVYDGVSRSPGDIRP